MRIVLTLLTLVALGYAALVGLLFAFQRSLLYAPGPAGPSPSAAGVGQMEEVRVKTSDGLDLLAWHSPPASSQGLTVVYLHGNAGSLAARAFKVRPLLDAGHGVLLLSWRGFGDNPGRPTEEGLYRDGRAAIAYLRDRGVRVEHMAFYGESLGSGVAVQMASETTPAAVILEAPFSSITDVAAAHYPFVPVRLLLKDRYDSASKIAAVRAPILILHGTRDAVVPLRFGRRLFDAASEPKRMEVFDAGGHENLHGIGAIDLILGFLEEVKSDGEILEKYR